LSVAVFGITGGESGRWEIENIVEAVRFAVLRTGKLRLIVLGRNAQSAEAELRKRLDDSAVELHVMGVLPGEDVVRSLSISDVLLFVRGPISTRRGSAIAGIACGLPVIASEGPETAAPITEAGLAFFSPQRKGDLGDVLLRVLEDEHFRTSVPSVYAAGDVIGFPALASTSMEQARLAVVHAFDLAYKKALAPILPYGIYTIPEVSMAGETEESLATKGVDYIVGRASFQQNARGQIIGDREGLLKLLFEQKTLKLLGVHVVGEQATELVHIGLTALLAGATADLFIQTCYNYPTLSETYKYATYDAMGKRDAAEALARAGS